MDKQHKYVDVETGEEVTEGLDKGRAEDRTVDGWAKTDNGNGNLAKYMTM